LHYRNRFRTCKTFPRESAGEESRIGDCRVAGVIADKVLIVYTIRVGHRKEVYRGM
jgi:mRNA-degrading endonuclease RelE of RelBE toxin-antitoxin system